MENNSMDRLREMGINEDMVTAVLKELLGGMAAAANTNPGEKKIRPVVKECDPSGLRVVRGRNIDMEYLDTGDPRVNCTYRSLLDTTECPHFMPVMLEIDHSSFDWYCGYSELDYVIEGTLELTIDGRKHLVHAGDVSYIPMRSHVNFASTDHCKCFAVVYPTNWGEYC